MINSCGKTDIGKERLTNDDAFWADDHIRIYAIADGLGGLPHGGLASSIAMETVKNHFSKGNSNIEQVFRLATEAVMSKGKELGEELGIATTLTIAWINGEKLHIGHVGDSGIFLIRDNKLQKLTTDHTMAQEMKDNAKNKEKVVIPDLYNHILTQSIGTTRELRVQEIDQDLLPGDRIILYTDGVTKTHQNPELALMATRSKSPEDLVDLIINQANDRGGPDNVTAVVIYVS